ncbi:MAG: HepT-like ribonuclease domain-containing protein [Terriglobia bacterium]
MPRLEVRKYLFDILQACELLLRFTAGKSLSDYSDDELLRSAVERQFEIAGEALSQALRLEPGLAGYISHTRRIIAFRNRLIHGYDSVADETVWGVLETDLPTLRSEVELLLLQPSDET